MQLTEIRMRLKSVEAAFDLSPVTIFTGGNGTGKSTILNAVELLLRARIIGIGARAGDLFRMAPDGTDSMLVKGAFGIFELTRVWRSKIVKDKPSVSADLDFTGISSDAIGRVSVAESELITRMRPSKFGINCRWFASESPSKRRKILLDMIWHAGTDSVDRPLAEWIYDSIASEGLEDGDMDYLSIVVDRIAKRITASMPIDQLRQFELECNSMVKVAIDELKIAEAEIRGLGYSGAAVDTMRLNEMRAALERIDGEIADLNARIARAEVEAEGRGKADQAIKDALPLELDSADVSEMKERKAEMKSNYEIELAKAAEYGATIEKLSIKIGEIEAAIVELKGLSANLDLFGSGKCVLSESIPCHTERSEIEAPIEDRIEALMAEQETARREIAEATEARTPHVNAYIKLNTEIIDLESAIEVSERARKSRIAAETTIAHYSHVDIYLLKTDCEAKRGEQKKLIDQIIEMEAEAKKAERNSEMEVSAAKLRREIRCVNKIRSTVGAKGLQGVLVKERIVPFVESVNAVLRTFDPGKEFFIEFADPRGNEDCIFGFIENGVRRTWETASNGEQTLIAVAMSIELMRRDERANVRILMIDNIEHLYSDNRISLINAATYAVNAGWIDNAIFAGAFNPDDMTDTSIHGEGIRWQHLN